MYTVGAAGLILLAGWCSTHLAKADPPSRHDDGEIRDMIRFTRQDMRLLAYLLGGILLMLGLIADRLR